MPSRIEYDSARARQRWLYALLVAVFWVLGDHGLRPYPVNTPCNGGWLDALEFLGEFVGVVVLLEVLGWVRWTVWEKPWSTLTADGQAEVVFRGDGLPFVPQRLFWSLLFIGACFGLFKWAGSPDPCEAAIFSWKHFLGCVSFACGVLGIVELGLNLWAR